MLLCESFGVWITKCLYWKCSVGLFLELLWVELIPMVYFAFQILLSLFGVARFILYRQSYPASLVILCRWLSSVARGSTQCSPLAWLYIVYNEHRARLVTIQFSSSGGWEFNPKFESPLSRNPADILSFHPVRNTQLEPGQCQLFCCKGAQTREYF